MTTNNDQDLSTIANDILEGDYTSAFARLALEMDAHLVEAGKAPSLTVLYDALNDLCRSFYEDLGDAGFPISAMFFANKTDDDFDDVIAKVFSVMRVRQFFVFGDREDSVGPWNLDATRSAVEEGLRSQGYDVQALWDDGGEILVDTL